MSSPGNPHQEREESASLFQRPFFKLGFASIIVGVSVWACSSPKVAVTSSPQPSPAASPTPKLNVATAKSPVPTYAVFHKTVQPFFAAHCYECHGPSDSEAGVRLDQFTD